MLILEIINEPFYRFPCFGFGAIEDVCIVPRFGWKIEEA